MLFAVPGIKAETALIALDLDGIAVSSGSACSSGKVTPSHVLAAMGVDAELARGAIRASLGLCNDRRRTSIASCRLGERWSKHYLKGSRELPHDAAKLRGIRRATNATETIRPAVLETAAEGRNAGRARDGRTGPPDRRRSVQVWVRDGHRIRQGPEGPERRHRPLHLGQEERAGVDARVAARGLSALADHGRAALGARRLSPDRLPGRLLLRGAEEERVGRSRSTRSIRRSLRTYEKLGIPLREQEILAGVEGAAGRRRRRRVAVDAVFEIVSVATTFKEELEEVRRDLLLDLRGDARAPRAGAQIPRLGRAR